MAETAREAKAQRNITACVAVGTAAAVLATLSFVIFDRPVFGWINIAIIAANFAIGIANHRVVNKEQATLP